MYIREEGGIFADDLSSSSTFRENPIFLLELEIVCFGMIPQEIETCVRISGGLLWFRVFGKRGEEENAD